VLNYKEDERNHQRLLLASALGLGLTLGVTILLAGPLPARAGPAAAVRYVTTTGRDFVSSLPNDCTNPKDPCGRLRHAVSRANPGDEIHVAERLYTDLHSLSGVMQVVYVDRSIVVRGGYTSDQDQEPQAAPHHAERQGRGTGGLYHRGRHCRAGGAAHHQGRRRRATPAAGYTSSARR
jgi:hypothetical protein